MPTTTTPTTFAARVDAYWEGLVVSVDSDADSYFSWHRCESCGSTLGGDRHEVSWFSMDDHAVTGSGSVCTDCAHYIANGEAPDEVAAACEEEHE